MTDPSMTATVAVGIATGILAIPGFLIGGRALLQWFMRGRSRTADEPILPTSSPRVDKTDVHYEAQHLHYNYVSESIALTAVANLDQSITTHRSFFGPEKGAPLVSKQQDGPNATPATEPTAISSQTRAIPLQQLMTIKSVATPPVVVVGTVMKALPFIRKATQGSDQIR
ncbi:uncharacterized protein P174DRAFT_434240 [Aspergillus novofumigatus IBT 16806]|uniref:Uncharacterized protein n=1 Tax=Aspergillus novofumigatus (strain IBT 16806) TaxID=1392255 RepID=A0A2I1C0R1_ASPN1|nr:uncharacterized protein P174DRAFT_434240 [Aspergillus novofumigatus IBT 16806]PKX91185.1 hypothetical protein P174DRAFT_434240 [Aspergillus novofumigatus IBT 16806]